MASQKLKDYINAQFKNGVAKEEIKESLRKVGWKEKDIAEGFGIVGGKLPNVFDLVREGFAVFKERFWNLLLIYLLPVFASACVILLLGIISLFVFGANFLSVLLKTKVPVFPPISQGVTVVLIIVVVVLIVGLAIFQLISGIALMAAVCNDQKISVKEAFIIGKKKLVSYWWLTVLSGFIVLGGAIFFLIPALVFAVWFNFSYYILITEGDSGLKALLKSKEYVKGYFWPVVGRMLGLSALLGIVMMVFVIGLQYVLSLIKLSSLGGVISSIINLFLPLLTMCVYVTLYKSLRTVKGDFEFKPSVGSKVVFSVFGIFGFLAIPLGVYLIIRTIALTGGMKLPQNGLNIPSIPGVMEQVITPMPASEI